MRSCSVFVLELLRPVATVPPHPLHIVIYSNVLAPLHSDTIADILVKKFRTFSNRQEAEMVQYVFSVELESIRKRNLCWTGCTQNIHASLYLLCVLSGSYVYSAVLQLIVSCFEQQPSQQWHLDLRVI